jgi:hypothetical protein
LRIMQHHGGTFAAQEQDGVFKIQITLPLHS